MSEATKPDFNHAILVESGCQWETVLYFNGEIVSLNNIGNEPFFTNLYARGMTIKSFTFRGDNYYGFHISEAEAKRIKRLLELYSAHVEYNKLAASNI